MDQSLSNGVKDKIAEVTWNLGGWNDHEIYSDQIYGYERGEAVYSGRSTTWTGKIALAYPSDYGYAADLGSCTQNLVNYDNSTCTSTNWMMNIITNNWNYWGWLLTPISATPFFAWSVYSSGFIFHVDSYAFNAYGVVPVLYLDSELSIKAGIGTGSAPYQLLV